MEHVPEGQTIIFEGPQRTGKTLGMVAWAYSAFSSGRDIFSNIGLTFEHAPLEFGDLVLEDGQSRFRGGHIVIDELNFFFDGRRSLSKPNVKFGAYLLQQKKQGCNVTGTTHNLEYLDLRIRDNYDFIIRPQVYPRYPEKPIILKLKIENGPLQPRLSKIVKFDCRPYLGMYNSFAVYDPFKNEEKKRERFSL